MQPGDSVEVAGYRFTFEGMQAKDGPNYSASEAEIGLYKGDQLIETLNPQKRVYRVQTMPMTESAIDAGLRRDIYVALGDPLGGDSWSVRLQYKPLIRFIWLGALLMALGGLLAASDKRYRVREDVTARTGAMVGGEAT